MKEEEVFIRAAALTMRREGGYTFGDGDAGGETNYGISLRFLRSEGLDMDADGDVDAQDVRGLTREGAVELYRRYFWERWGYGGLPEGLSWKVFDAAVNAGPRRAALSLQRGLRACLERVEEDGILGSRTRGAALRVGEGELLSAMRAELASFYRGLGGCEGYGRYVVGWLRRAYDEDGGMGC